MFGIGAVWVAAITRIVWEGRHSRGTRVSTGLYVFRAVAAEVAVLPAAIAGMVLLAGSPGGLWVQAIGASLAIAVGVSDAWILLVEILR